MLFVIVGLHSARFLIMLFKKEGIVLLDIIVILVDKNLIMKLLVEKLNLKFMILKFLKFYFNNYNYKY